MEDNKKLVKVKVMQDEDGHNYIIPNELMDEFNKDLSNYDMIDSGEFDEKYSKYMTGVVFNNIQLYAEI